MKMMSSHGLQLGMHSWLPCLLLLLCGLNMLCTAVHIQYDCNTNNPEECDVRLSIKRHEHDNNQYVVSVESTKFDWVAVGFSNTTLMSDTLATICSKYENTANEYWLSPQHLLQFRQHVPRELSNIHTFFFRWTTNLSTYNGLFKYILIARGNVVSNTIQKHSRTTALNISSLQIPRVEDTISRVEDGFDLEIHVHTNNVTLTRRLTLRHYYTNTSFVRFIVNTTHADDEWVGISVTHSDEFYHKTTSAVVLYCSQGTAYIKKINLQSHFTVTHYADGQNDVKLLQATKTQTNTVYDFIWFTVSLNGGLRTTTITEEDIVSVAGFKAGNNVSQILKHIYSKYNVSRLRIRNGLRNLTFPDGTQIPVHNTGYALVSCSWLLFGSAFMLHIFTI